jgi:hypothetical protein
MMLSTRSERNSRALCVAQATGRTRPVEGRGRSSGQYSALAGLARVLS